MLYCMHCGNELSDGTVFCTKCGNKLTPIEQVEFAGAETIQSSCDPVKADKKTLTGGLHAMMPSSSPLPTDDRFEEAQSAAPDPMPYCGVFPEAEPVEPPSSKVYERNRKAVSLMYSGSPRIYTFQNTGLGLILIFVLLGVTAILGVVTPMFFNAANLMNVVKQCGVYALVAMAVVLSMRARGIDLSIGPMMGMSAAIIAQTMLMGSPLINGVLLAAAAAMVLGLVNGFVVSFLKAPAVITTLVSGVVVGGVSIALTQGQMRAVTFSERVQAYASESPVGVLALLGTAFVFALFYNILSRTGLSLFDRKNERPFISYIFAYVVSAEIAAAAGFVLLVRLQTVTPALGMGYEAFIVFVFALLTASRAFDNRFVPALIALVPAMIWGALTNIFALWGVVTFYQPVVYGALALVCLAVAFICQYEKYDEYENLVREYIEK